MSWSPSRWGDKAGHSILHTVRIAQAYFLDSNSSWDEPIVLRTSGLLSRSNKIMYDLNTGSVIDTFTSVALSGPLQDAGVTLEQTTVVGSYWGDWKTEHPDTMIVARDGGIGRTYPDDPLQGRDAAGPIFPVGDVDPRPQCPGISSRGYRPRWNTAGVSGRRGPVSSREWQRCETRGGSPPFRWQWFSSRADRPS